VPDPQHDQSVELSDECLETRMTTDSTEPPKQPPLPERLFDFTSQAGCERAMRNGAIGLFAFALLSGYMGFTAFWGSPTGSAELDARLGSMRDPWLFVNAVVYAVLGVFVYRRSRAAATLAVLYVVAVAIARWLVLGRVPLNIFHLFFLALLAMAMAASFQWHRRYAAEAAQGTQSMRPLTGSAMGGDLPAARDGAFMAALRFIFGLLAAFAVFGTAASMWELVEEPGSRSVASLLLSAVMLFAAISAYQALKLSAIKAAKFALLLFVLGYVGSAAYRLIFVPGGEGPQVFDLLAFGIPTALVLFRAWQESRRTATG
jgi:hypothetical protein